MRYVRGVPERDLPNRGDTCCCINGVAEKQSRRITKVLGGKPLPVVTCQRDKSLK
ncbi:MULTISPECIES: DUF4087 domain-containing protein [unclassified Caballeronia]|uniref:DUF4087 domain-containing protein n=1 Tax=unclassified Caballeronia TaxID=2646786 RepID=UPI003F5019CD